MKFRFTISKRLGLGFGILTIAVLLSSILIYMTLSKNRQISERIITVYAPSISGLNDLYIDISNAKILIKHWVATPGKSEKKQELEDLHNTKFQETKDSLMVFAKHWEKSNIKLFEDICISIEDTLFEKQRNIMNQLSDFDKYDDIGIKFLMASMVEEGGEVIIINEDILTNLEKLKEKVQDKSEKYNVDMMKSFDGFQRFITIIGIVLFIVALLIAIFTIKSIVSPINSLKSMLLFMSRGQLPEEKLKIRNDEIGEMANALNSYINSQRSLSEFSHEIGNGNYDTKFTPLSDEDILGNSLISMKENLKNAATIEKQRKQEDEQRNWITLGLAKFGDILRQNNDNLEELSYNIISNLVKYMKANQGGMFILNDDEKDNIHLELMSAYAYDRKKFLKRTIKRGEGLVGTCLVEKQTIFMTDIPDSYLNITSGLGKANPRCLLIVPLKVNDEIFGILEIASFKKLEKYQIQFVEKVGENIASTISSVKINTTTARLLQESKERGEQLVQQEEEMRQNLEELQSTQEESARRIAELEKSLDIYNSGVIVFEIDLEGNILNANENTTNTLYMSYDDLVGKNHQMLISPEYLDYDSYQEMLHDFNSGINHKTEHAYETNKGLVWMKESYRPIRNYRGQYDRIMVLGMDITKVKKEAITEVTPE